MKLLVLGDVHGNIFEWQRACAIANEKHCVAMVQVGDFGYFPRFKDSEKFIYQAARKAKNLNVPAYFLDGNHEDHPSLFSLEKSDNGFASWASHLHYVPRGHAWEWGGVKFLALGGAFSIDRRARVEGLTYFNEEVIRYQDVEASMKAVDALGGSVDVMFTHDAPRGVMMFDDSRRFKQDRLSVGNRKAIREVVEYAKPKYLFHGHMHVRHSTQIYLRNGAPVKVEGLSCDGMSGNYVILDVKPGNIRLR